MAQHFGSMGYFFSSRSLDEERIRRYISKLETLGKHPGEMHLEEEKKLIGIFTTLRLPRRAS